MKQNNDREPNSLVLWEEKHFVIFCKILFHKKFPSQKLKWWLVICTVVFKIVSIHMDKKGDNEHYHSSNTVLLYFQEKKNVGFWCTC